MRVRLFALFLFAAASAGPRPAEARERTAPLQDRIARRVAKGAVKAGKIGISIVSLDTGEVVAESGASTALVPASVAKVFTAAAALDLLGPGWTYETSVDACGQYEAATGTVEGDLVVHGTGDPNLSKRGHENDPQWPLSALAKDIAARGIRRVTGSILLDDGPFDRQFVHPTWTLRDLSQWYGAPVAGLSFNDSCDATDHPIRDPLAWFGSEFVEALKGAGVAVAKGARPAGTASDRAPGSRLSAVTNGLAATLRVMNKKSQNFYASLVFKACGAAALGSGSFATGALGVLTALERRGIVDPGLKLVDGSGLSDDNRASASAVARLLASMDRDVLRGPILRDSLAVPGEDGTLQKRFRDPASRGRIRAKTGTLANREVHSLAGYVDGKAGSPFPRGFAFAVLLNDNPADGDARDLIDDVVREVLDE